MYPIKPKSTLKTFFPQVRFSKAQLYDLKLDRSVSLDPAKSPLAPDGNVTALPGLLSFPSSLVVRRVPSGLGG